MSILKTLMVFNALIGFSLVAKASTPFTAPDFVYYNQAQIIAIQHKLRLKEPEYVNALSDLESQAEKVLAMPIESVLDKPKPALSGDLQDYLSLAPYFWPDPNTKSGLPWVRKDGEVNPLTRGENTDKVRSGRFLTSLGTLFVAYTYTLEPRYADKMKALLNTWLVDPKTRMNPHLNYAQGIPGINNGRPFGIIEWVNISNVVSALQILKHHQQLDDGFIAKADSWLRHYKNWLMTSKLGADVRWRRNNHGSWYDYQVVGLLMYLGDIERAKARLSDTRKRINEQIEADGSQPHELRRTKSVNYSSMNLNALVHVAYLGQKLGIDLWAHQGKRGQSLAGAIRYFYPFLRGEKTWIHKQLGGVDQAFQNKTYPMLNLTHALIPQFELPADIATLAEPAQSSEEKLLFYRL